MKRCAVLLSVLSASLLMAAVPYQRKVPKTYVFSRAQWHYTPELDYYGRWLDRPTLLDPEMIDPVATVRAIGSNAKLYNLDGLASLFGARTGELIRNLERAKVPGFILLAEIYSTGGNMYEKNKDLKSAKLNFDKVFIPALKSKVALRINGKVVISSYNADKRPPEFWRDVLALYRKQYGDKFAFLPHLVAPGGKGWHHWNLTWHRGNAAVKEKIKGEIKKHFRAYLRTTDGLYIDCAPTRSAGDRHTDMKFYQFMIDTAKEVLAEAPFKNKLFAISSRLGHKNGTRIGYIRGSYGTWCYRGTLGRALAAQPDIIIIPEWDEQNENTSLRPTLYNHSTFTRVTRHMTGKSATLPGDDTTVPNLIISYRKVLALGEYPEYELLSLPCETGSYSARFILKGSGGNVLYTSPWKEFSGKKMEELRVKVDTVPWANEDFVTVEVETRQNGKVRSFGNMQYIRIEKVNNFDYKYVKQPLRDLLSADVKESFDDNGNYQVKVKAATPVDWAELMENGVEIYTHSPRPFLLETPAVKVFSIRMQTVGKAQFISGTMSVDNASSLWYGPELPVDMAKSGKVTLKRFRQSMQMKRWIVTVPAKEVGKAVLNIDLPGHFTGKIKLADVLKNHVYGIPVQGMVSISVLRQNFQCERPLKLRKKEFAFTAPAYTPNRGALYNFQLVDANGRTWRGKPFRRTPVTRDIRRICVWSEKLNKPVTLTVAGSEVPVIEYRPDAKFGTAMVTDAGRKYYGIAGGFASQISCLFGAYRDSTVYISGVPENMNQVSVPIVDGVWQLGKPGQVLQLPTGVISRRSAFKFTVEVRQKNASGIQTLVETRASNIGLFQLTANNGELVLVIRDRNGSSQQTKTGLRLPLNQWATVTCDFALDKMTVSVNGRKKVCKARGIGVYDTCAGVGGGPLGVFKGDIRRIITDYRR
ncbi:MAG: hypothetical protein IKC89_03285 [Lentisphaeria bacterium]|nr:hypothetical protein [Lentisphaeria bacterium]